MKKLIFILLALPMLAAAQPPPVQVQSCSEGCQFTIKIPVKFPDSMTVQYAWYRNDTLIAGTAATLAGAGTIAYTIPDALAYGSALYHFAYRLSDEPGAWSRSPRYNVSFAPLTLGVVNLAGCNGVSAMGAIDLAACKGVSAMGAISFAACRGVSAMGAISFAACKGVSAMGTISIK